MTDDDFRRLALSLPGATESAHMGHPDFRVSGRIFATLRYPDEHWGMVKLSPEEQHGVCGTHPDAFVPVKGAAMRYLRCRPCVHSYPTSARMKWRDGSAKIGSTATDVSALPYACFEVAEWRPPLRRRPRSRTEGLRP